MEASRTAMTLFTCSSLKLLHFQLWSRCASRLGKCVMRVDAKSIWNGTVHRIASLGFMAALALAGCTADELPRPPRSQAELIEARKTDEAAFAAFRRDIALRGIARVKANYDAYAAGRGPEPIIDLLVISGGGDWGAFGAGVLKGWGRVSGPTARPQFDAVTGVSTGALIAPFAFLGLCLVVLLAGIGFSTIPQPPAQTEAPVQNEPVSPEPHVSGEPGAAAPTGSAVPAGSPGG